MPDPTPQFGTCCKELKDALSSPSISMFRVEEDGRLCLRVGYVEMDEGRGWYDQPIFHCPFCGQEVQDREKIGSLAPQVSTEDGFKRYRSLVVGALVFPAIAIALTLAVSGNLWLALSGIVRDMGITPPGWEVLRFVEMGFGVFPLQATGLVLAVLVVVFGYWMTRRAKTSQAALVRALIVVSLAWLVFSALVIIFYLGVSWLWSEIAFALPS